jgi:pyrroline-5-carboxylate reductase
MEQIDLGNKRVGFIGAGQMAEALARGFINKSVVKAENICATDPVSERREVFRSFGATAFESNVEVVDNSDIVFISVKPQYVAVVLKEVKPNIKSHQIVVSIAAGITLQSLKVRGMFCRFSCCFGFLDTLVIHCLIRNDVELS